MATVLAVGVGVAAAAFFVRHAQLDFLRQPKKLTIWIGSRWTRRTPKISRRYECAWTSILQRRIRKADESAGGGVDTRDTVRLLFGLRLTAAWCEREADLRYSENAAQRKK
jgi:hypothetical protein